MEYKRMNANLIQENIFSKAKSQSLKGGLQNNTTKRHVLGDICSNNNNIRLQQPANADKNIDIIDKEKKNAIGRPQTRSYKNVQAKVDTRLPVKVPSVANNVTNENKNKPLRREESTIALATKAGVLTQRLRQTKISSNNIKKSDSKENLIPKDKEKKTVKPINAKIDLTIPIKKISEIKEIKAENAEVSKKDSYSTELLDGVEDIDAGQEKNPILMSIYIKDIYSYLRDLETKYPIAAQYLEGHLYMTSKMRSTLIDWLVQVHTQFNLLLETLHLTVAIIDRYLQVVKTIERVQIQLVGITAMFIASKYEEMFPPDITDYVYITDNTYTRREILKCEKSILTVLDFSLGRPLPLHFVRRLIKAANVTFREHLLAKYVVDLCLVEYQMVHYRPSELASAAVCLSISLLSPDKPPKTCWTPTLSFYSGYSFSCIAPLVKQLAGVLAAVETSRYKAVRDKYNSSKNGKVAKYPELAAAVNLSK